MLLQVEPHQGWQRCKQLAAWGPLAWRHPPQQRWKALQRPWREPPCWQTEKTQLAGTWARQPGPREPQRCWRFRWQARCTRLCAHTAWRGAIVATTFLEMRQTHRRNAATAALLTRRRCRWSLTFSGIRDWGHALSVRQYYVNESSNARRGQPARNKFVVWQRGSLVD